MISFRVVPMATSTRPVLRTFPERANTFVPLLPAVPRELNHSAPFLTMSGTLARVSTLFIAVGLPKRPDTAGYGGLGLGMPRLPSMLCMRAVSSPHTKAPAPIFTTMSRSMPLSRMFRPIRPCSRAASMASLSRRMARGYSARM